jgi:hypothetical protein
MLINAFMVGSCRCRGSFSVFCVIQRLLRSLLEQGNWQRF